MGGWRRWGVADDWRQPSRHRAGQRFLARRAHEAETWETRLLAVLVAIPVFEASLLLGLLALSKAHPGYAVMMMLQLPLALHLSLSGVAVAVGAIWGMGGITWLLGHLFWTHPASQQSTRMTLALWAGMLGLPLVLFWLGR